MARNRMRYGFNSIFTTLSVDAHYIKVRLSQVPVINQTILVYETITSTSKP